MKTETTINPSMAAQRLAADYKAVTTRIIICAGTGCVANGSLKLYDACVEMLENRNCQVTVELSHDETHAHEGMYVSKSGCQGFCQMGPLVCIMPHDILYVKVKPGDVADIIDKTVLRGEVIERLLYTDESTHKRYNGFDTIPFYTQQSRQVLASCGRLNPEDIYEYIAEGGYQSAQKAITGMNQTEICTMIEEAGLRGRGGGGFPTGKKWHAARIEPGPIKYIICNGDEGDPGAFMDRAVMEGNPHSVIEGMIIAASAIGACKGYIYVRMEYPLAVQRIRKAVDDARSQGLLGDSLYGTGFSFDITVMEGAGAFVCGEETALISSVEGKRGMPTPKPPFPAKKGLFGKPSIINNVETLATIPLILKNGVAGFRSVGTPKSPGTKTFALTGHVVNTGLIEVPFGTTLRTIVYDIGGGITGPDGKPCVDGFKAVQIGGPSGACLTKEHLDLPLDFDSLRSIGAMVGSGGLVVMNSSVCMVRIARFFMQFTQNESCGKCVSCREGTKQMLVLLDDIIEGKGTMETIELLRTLARVVSKASLCGLGKTAPNPVISTLTQFADEYIAHITEKRCPTGECKNLRKPSISAEKCRGCTICVKVCPVGAISGERKKPHVIDDTLCINCKACVNKCTFNAIN